MDYQQIQLVILATLGIIGILLVFLLLKMNHVKKQIDTMQKKVEKYVTYIIEETEEESKVSRYAALDTRRSGLKDDEEKNELIQNVLQEIFP